MQHAAGLEVEQLAEDVDAGDVEVVLALPVGELLVQLAGLGVDEVRRERAGVTPEQRVGQGAVLPEEARSGAAGRAAAARASRSRLAVSGRRVWLNKRAVRQRELQVPGDERRLERLAVAVGRAR